MKRLIENKLIQWKETNNKKILLIHGQRQIGKTYSILKFGHTYYEHVIEINFERDKDFKEQFDSMKNVQELYNYIQLSFPDIPLDQTTLLFLDEIQACSAAITTLKFMKDVFSCDIICSGSMLGIAIATTSSFPVGYIETWKMYPFTFSEFLMALQMPDSIFDTMKQAYLTKSPIPDGIHNKLNDYFTIYTVVGGLPEAISTYIHTKSILSTLTVQRRIMNDYYNDIAKYGLGSDRIKARECLESVPLQLAKENKKFQYKLVKKGYNARYFENSLRWLKDSGLTIQCHRLKTIQKPLEVYKELGIFKVYMADTGLLISQFDNSVVRDILQNETNIYSGALTENIVAQTLNRFEKKLYYYEPNSTTEIDFVIPFEGEITPIEVKAGRNVQSKSLHYFIQNNNSKIAFRFSKKNIGEIQNESIQYLPLYLLETVLENEKQLLF